MKRYKGLYEKIWAWDNLLEASYKAEKGKRQKPYVAKFNLRKERNLLELGHELKTQSYKPGQYHTFEIHEPKRRLISAAPYRDRVLHHAVCQIIMPLFERSFIDHSYANRKDKGTHQAILYCQKLCRRYKYALKCDIRKFFPSLDHQVLKEELGRKIGCTDTLALLGLIIDNSNPQEPRNIYFPGDDLFTPFERKRGLPIGNLTSQHFANIYLSRLDHFIQEDLGLKYLRYVDDFVVFANQKSELHLAKKQIRNFLGDYRLQLHPKKSHIVRTAAGISFLGFRIYPRVLKVKKENLRRARKRIKNKIGALQQGDIDLQELEHSINSWIGHIQFSNNHSFQADVIESLREQGVYMLRRPTNSWLVIEVDKAAFLKEFCYDSSWIPVE